VKKAEDYRRHADECRALARNATSDDERRQLIHMAETWLGLAQQRLQMLSANAIEAVRATEEERSAVQPEPDSASV
jgi:hypothetical protein